jgi:hypothetical protein
MMRNLYHIDDNEADSRKEESASVSTSARLESLGFTSGVNASGHADQLQRQYRLKSISAAAVVIDGAWYSM